VVLQYAVLHRTGYPLSIGNLKQQRQWGPRTRGTRVRAHGHAAVVALLAHGLASGR
jgi:transketolase